MKQKYDKKTKGEKTDDFCTINTDFLKMKLANENK